MPLRSERAQLLQQIEEAAEHLCKFGSDSEDVEEGMEMLVEAKLVLCSSRYLQRPSKYKQDVDVVSEEWFGAWLSETRFVLYCKMGRRSFEWVYSHIRDHPVFSSGLSPSCQRSVQFQVFVALSRLAQSGSAGSQLKVAQDFKLSSGAVHLYTTRVLRALEPVGAKFIKWPNAARRRLLSAIGEEEFGFPGFILSVDGTLLCLHRAPAFKMRPETYCHPRHKKYGFNTLFFTDHMRYIVSYVFGWPGQAADSTIMGTTALAKAPQDYLCLGQEFVFADLGFRRENWCITPFKGAASLLKPNAMFNQAQRSGRCRIEHVNGQIKSRFRSLTAMPIDIKCKAHVRYAHRWVRACITLHNILVYLKDDWDFPALPPEAEVEFTLDDVKNVSGKEMQVLVRDRWLRDVKGWVPA